MRSLVIVTFLLSFGMTGFAEAQEPAAPAPPGVMVDLGGHRLHVDCVGSGSPTVVIENAFDEFSSDWVAVQTSVAQTNRVCTYDRAGYAWSEPGPKPRTFAQINLELHDALKLLKENAPFVLVGHGFGAPLARNYALTYPAQVAGLIFVDGVSEDQRFEMWHRAVLMRAGAKGKPIPEPRETLVPDDKVEIATYYRPATTKIVHPPFNLLPPTQQRIHLWAQSRRSLAAAEENEREWSPEYFANWHEDPSRGQIGSTRLIVLTREKGGFRDLDLSAAQQEEERQETQHALTALSSNSEQQIIQGGEYTEVENPAAIVDAIRTVKISRRTRPTTKD